MKPIISKIDKDEYAFYVRDKDNNIIVSVSHIGEVIITYPIKGIVPSNAMKDFHTSEKENCLELIIHCVSRGNVDRIWSMGKINPDYIEETKKWIEKVNLFYKR